MNSNKVAQKMVLLKRLAKVEKELAKNRTTVMVDGWQTMRHTKKSRNWDYYAQQKRDIQDQLDDLEEIYK